MNNEVKVGLALGSGASRGLAHFGVIKALLEEKIPIDIISGSSIGALVGCLFSVGIELEMLVKLAKHLDTRQWIDFTVPRKGFIKGTKIEELIKLLTKNKNLEQLEIPTFVVATDLKNCRRHVFSEGPIWRAVRSSISIPGIFTPVEYQDMVLVDGGVIDRVPAGILKEKGADIVIGVDVGFSAPIGKTDSIFDIIIQSIDIMEREILKDRIIEADILISPDLKGINPANFNQVDECVESGYEATKKILPLLIQKLQIAKNEKLMVYGERFINKI